MTISIEFHLTNSGVLNAIAKDTPSELLLHSLTGNTTAERVAVFNDTLVYGFKERYGNVPVNTATVDRATIETYRNKDKGNIPDEYFYSEGEQTLNYRSNINRLVQLPCNNVTAVSVLEILDTPKAIAKIGFISKHLNIMVGSDTVHSFYRVISSTLSSLALAKRINSKVQNRPSTEICSAVSYHIAEYLHHTLLAGIKLELTDDEYDALVTNIGKHLLTKRSIEND